MVEWIYRRGLPPRYVEHSPRFDRLGRDAPVKLDAGGDGLEALLGALQGEKIY